MLPVLMPHGWPCRLSDCPPGLFGAVKSYGADGTGSIGVKTAYGRSGAADADGKAPWWTDAYLIEGGDSWRGGANTDEERESLLVQPLVVEWREVER